MLPRLTAKWSQNSGRESSLSSKLNVSSIQLACGSLESEWQSLSLVPLVSSPLQVPSTVPSPTVPDPLPSMSQYDWVQVASLPSNSSGFACNPSIPSFPAQTSGWILFWRWSISFSNLLLKLSSLHVPSTTWSIPSTKLGIVSFSQGKLDPS